VREAVTNALMHRDLSPHARGSQVQVNLYADRLEILNPGGLYGVVTLAEPGRAGVSASRNQLLSVLLEEVPYPGGGMVAENRGSGYAMIQAALADNGAPPPVPRDAIAHFSLALYRRPEQPASARATTRDRVADIVRTTGPITARDIAGQLGLSRSAIVQHLRALAEAGQVSPTEPPHSRRQRYRWSA
jgi:ATP-dependent DNA helicase RecG